MAMVGFIWNCSNCGSNTKGWPDCGRCGYRVDLKEQTCIHGYAYDMACDDCGRSGFRFDGVNTPEDMTGVNQVAQEILDELSADGPGFQCERIKDKTMTEEKWRTLHEPHGEITRQDNLSQPPSYKLFWLICPCGARLQCMEELEGVD